MNYILVSYKSRSKLLALFNKLKTFGVFASLVNTPRSVSVSCGLSIKTSRQHVNLIIKLIHQGHSDGFLGIFAITKDGFRENAQKIY